MGFAKSVSFKSYGENTIFYFHRPIDTKGTELES